LADLRLTDPHAVSVPGSVAVAIKHGRYKPVSGNAFPPVLRLLKPSEFAQVFKRSERARTDSLLVMALPNQLAHARLGMVIAKRLLPRAVDRNRVKRCVRETFRTQRALLPACDFVVRLIAKPGFAKPDPGKAAAELARTFARAGQRATSKWPIPPSTEHSPIHG
jgi:ribonuclease P protein component